MTITSAQHVNHDVPVAEGTFNDSPVLTQQGQPKHILLDVAEYRRLASERAAAARARIKPSLPTSSLFALPEGQSFDWEPDEPKFIFVRE